MKTIVLIIKKERLLWPALWFALIITCAILFGSCTGNDDYTATNQTKIYAPVSNSSKIADVANADKSNTADVAYSNQEPEGQTAPATVNPATASSKSGGAVLPLKTEKAFEKPVGANTLVDTVKIKL